MIVNFSIQNFGSIKEKQTLSFEAETSDNLENYYIIEVGKYRLLKTALIYGANASGKTTILKALDFLQKMILFPLEKKTNTFDFEPFLFDAHTPKQNTIFNIEFIQNKVKYIYEVEFNKQAIIKEELLFFNPNKAVVFTRTTNENKQLSEIKFGSKIKVDKEQEKALAANTIWNNTVFGGGLKTNLDIIELQEATNWFSQHLTPLIQT